MKPSVRDLALPHVARLEAYVPGLQPAESGWVKLNTNENPSPPSPAVIAAARTAAGEALRLYPDPQSRELRAAIAKHHGLCPEQVLAGNGSDEILQLLARAFLSPEAACAYAVPSYSLYPVLADMQGAPRLELELDRSMSLPLERLSRLDAPVFFLTSPNAPTGAGWPRARVAAAADAFRGLLVVDEAYADFAAEDAAPLVGRVPNLAVVRTFSKSRSLAGMRVGYLLGSPELVQLIDGLRDSYNLSRVAQAAARAAIEDQAYYGEVTRQVVAERDAFLARLDALGWFTYRSQANFVFTEPRDAAGRSGAEVSRACYEFLLGRRILVRHFPRHPLTAPFLRITVGEAAQMQTLWEALQSWLRHAPPH